MGGGGGGGAARLFLAPFPCLADHERDSPPCQVVFFGLATNTRKVRRHPNILTFPPLTGGCSEGLNAFIFFFKQQQLCVPFCVCVCYRVQVF